MNWLLADIENTATLEPTLWWLGKSGFAIKFHSIVFYIDPWLPADVRAEDITNADMILRTHYGDVPDDPTAAILGASPKAKLIIPKSTAEAAHAHGISYHRMTTTDADLRVEYFKGGVYGRVYSVPSSQAGLHWTPLGGYPYLGYLIRFGEFTIYHPGASAPYAGLAERLNPYNVTVALIPVGQNHFSMDDAAELAKNASVRWLVPMHCEREQMDSFALHMLGFTPEQRFKIFEPGQGWTIPAE